MLTSLARRWFSTFKVAIDAIKKLREETSAPMGECKKALEESQGNHEMAMLWLRQKGLTTAQKRSQKQTREGVIASFLTPCRRKAILLQVNCQTDFVAKNQLFLRFVEGVGARLLQRQQLFSIQTTESQTVKAQFSQLLESTQPANVFPEQATAKNLNEQLKLVISRLQQNIRIRRVVTLHSDNCRYGSYVHRPYAQGVGVQACVVELEVQPQPEGQEAEDAVNEFADDVATQILGSPPKYLNYEEIPQEEISVQTEKARVELAATLQRAPEHTHDKIISGKLLSTFYSRVLLGCMPYLLSNEGAQVSEYWEAAERASGTEIKVVRALTWQCK